jgi:hypothetical protein
MRILRGLGSRALPCGCLVGVYETYAGRTVAIIDAKGSECQDRQHRVNSGVDFQMVDMLPQAGMPLEKRHPV